MTTMRMIDADELPKVKFHPLPYTHIVPSDLKGLQAEAYERGWNDAIDAIVENADTADVVEVVRCKDCAYSWGEGHACGKWNALVEPDDFCSAAKVGAGDAE